MHGSSYALSVYVVHFSKNGVTHTVEKPMAKAEARKRIELHQEQGEAAWSSCHKLSVEQSDFPSDG